MDLLHVDTKSVANDGAILNLRHPSTGEVLEYESGGEKKAMHLLLLGQDSDAFQKAQYTSRNKMLKKLQRNRTTSMSAEEAEQGALELLACAVAGGKVFLAGQEVDVTAANIVDLFTRFPWMKEQADEFVADRANFLPSS